MAYLNRVTLIGRLGKDPEYSTCTNGNSRCAFTIATSKRYHDGIGEMRELVEWHSIVAFGHVADLVHSIGLRKGNLVYIEGSLASYTYQNPGESTPRRVVGVNMSLFQILENKKDRYKGQPYPYRREEQTHWVDDADLPF